MSREASLRVLRPFWSHPSLAPPDLRFMHSTKTLVAPSQRNASGSLEHILPSFVSNLWPFGHSLVFTFPCISSVSAWLVELPWRRLRHGADHRIYTRPCQRRMVATKRLHRIIVLDAQTARFVKDACTCHHPNHLCVRHCTKALLPRVYLAKNQSTQP